MKYFLIIPMDFFLYSFFFVLWFPQYIYAYCWQTGLNPSFSGPPVVSTISANEVRVSWKDIVTNRRCADEFLVKYWKKNFPEDYKKSKLVGTDANFIDLTVLPDTTYIFQAIAREDKGILGVDYNKALRVEFRTRNTTNNNVTTESNVDNTSGYY